MFSLRLILRREWVAPATHFVAFATNPRANVGRRANGEVSHQPVLSTLVELACAEADLVVRPTMTTLRRITGLTARSLAATTEKPFALATHYVRRDPLRVDVSDRRQQVVTPIGLEPILSSREARRPDR